MYDFLNIINVILYKYFLQEYRFVNNTIEYLNDFFIFCCYRRVMDKMFMKIWGNLNKESMSIVNGQCSIK